MERSSRSKRNYYYDQDYDSQAAAAAAAAAMPRTKQRFHHNNNNHHYNNNNNNNNHRRGGGAGRMVKSQQDGGGGGGGGAASPTLTTSYRILCHDIKAGGVIGKSGSIIKAIRQETGAWINVHQLIPGDEERIIEISEARRRDPDGRIPAFSPAQEALMMIHERIIESDAGFGFAFDAGSDDSDEFGPRGGAGRVATRLVVAKANVGCLLGKGGKIIEQMRIETKTQIRILPRDHTLPQCVSMSEEIVQVVGDVIAVKKALGIISARLRESQLRDRSHFHGRSQDQFFPQDDDFAPHMNNMSRRGSLDGPPLGPRFPSGMTNARSNSFGSRSSGYGFESGTSPMDDQAQAFHVEDLVFQILCPNGMVDRVMGEKDGIIEMLRVDIGVDVRVTDPVVGSEERIIVISSDEGPDDDLFPAQEALLHIQSKIVDLGPDKDNIITTRLLVPSSEISCLEGRDGSLSDMEKLSGANIKILPKEDFPICALGPDELVQIVGEITAARDALVEITSRLRSYLFREVSFPKDLPPPPSIPTPGYAGSISGAEVVSLSPNKNPTREGYQGSEIPIVGHQNVQTATAVWPSKDFVAPVGFPVDRKENDGHEEPPSGLNRLSVPLVTRSILEVVIPEHAISKLTMRSGNKLAQISELSGATVRLVEDRPEPEKVIQISGTPEQAERAQSLLQGFILSTQEDAPSS